MLLDLHLSRVKKVHRYREYLPQSILLQIKPTSEEYLSIQKRLTGKTENHQMVEIMDPCENTFYLFFSDGTISVALGKKEWDVRYDHLKNTKGIGPVSTSVLLGIY